jgi:hypothetical protein
MLSKTRVMKTHVIQTPLEDQLMRILDDVPNTRDRQLVGRVLGWDGRGGCSLQAAGEEAGVTRERARQIYGVVVRRIRSRTLCPLLDEVLEFVDRRCNRAAADIQTEMQLKGLTRHCFRMQALVKTAEAFGRATEFVLETRHGNTFVVSDPGLVDAILKAALRSTSRYGVQTVSEICSAISLDSQNASDHLLVRQVLRTRSDFRWLDARKQCFWLSSVPRNPVVLGIKKLLYYAGPTSFADVHGAMGRVPRKRRAPLTYEAVVGLCKQAPFCRVKNGSVELARSFRSGKLLSSAEATVYRILRRNGGELSVERFQSLCDKAGITRPTFWRIVLYSPLIFRSARRIYRLMTQSAK